MKRLLIGCSILLLVAGCGSGEAGSQEPATGAQEAVGQALESGENLNQKASGDACSMMKAIVPELFEVDPSALSFYPSKHVNNEVCRVTWPAGENASPMRPNHEVSLTIMGTAYDSPGAAVAALESDVETLSKGITVEVRGQKHTRKSQFGEWIEGVGDRAITKKAAVLVAADGRRFTVGVQASESDKENLALAIELARRVADGM